MIEVFYFKMKLLLLGKISSGSYSERIKKVIELWIALCSPWCSIFNNISIGKISFLFFKYRRYCKI